MLTDSEIKKAITEGHFSKDGKPSALALDGDNLWFEIMGSGTGCWRFRFLRPLNAKPTRMSLGIYPATGVKLARQKAQAARALLAAGKDPVEQRQKDRDAARARRTFEEVITEWFAAFRDSDTSRSAKTLQNDRTRRDQLIELFGKKLIAAITTAEIQQALIRIANSDGHKAKARLLRAMMREVFVYAIPLKYCTDNPAAGFKLPGINEKNHAAIVAPSAVGQLMRDIGGYDGRVFTRAALEVMAHTFPRPANIAAMEWSEIVNGVWIIPAHKMKMRREHRVPLSRQVLEILARLRPLTNSRFVFSTGDKPMATRTLNRALHSLGYAGKHVAHGFRSTASTLLNAECRWPKDIVELQLAHGDEDKIRAAYNRVYELEAIMGQTVDATDRLWQLRTRMTQHWSDKLDGLRDQATTGTVVPLHQAA